MHDLARSEVSAKKLKLHWRTPQSSLNRLTSVRSPRFKVSPNCASSLAGSNTFYYIGGYNRVRLYFRFIYIKAAATMQPRN
jgi:hypothetical protein